MRIVRQRLLLIIAMLIAIGIVMVYSASAIYAYERVHDAGYYLKHHLIWLLIGVMAAGFVMTQDLEAVRRLAKPCLLLSIGLLIIVLIPGVAREVGGAKRWLHFGPLRFQPSEVAKLALVIYLADFLSRKGLGVNDFFRGLMPPLAILAAMLLLVLLQPDLGRVIELTMITSILFFLSGIDLKYLMNLALLGIPGVYLAVWHVPYRRERILSFLNPWVDSQGSGFQMVQSYLALGSGGLVGVGLGDGVQKLFYLPEAHTDFIFSIIGEELGFVGTFAVCILFALFFAHGILITSRCANRFACFLAFGVTSMITLEALINICVATGLMPTKGLPLPFISYGGSALVVNLVGVGLLFNASRTAE